MKVSHLVPVEEGPKPVSAQSMHSAQGYFYTNPHMLYDQVLGVVTPVTLLAQVSHADDGRVQH